jgi:MIP family channel proteins
MPIRLSTAVIAEFIGTFALCFIGILSIHSVAGAGPGVGLVAVALAHGLAIAVMVSATIQTSGGHFNPAVTAGFIVTGKIKPAAGVAYILAQLLAGVLASALILGCFSIDAKQVVADGTPQFDPAKLGAGMAVVIEAVLTFFLVFSIWGSAADPRARNISGFAIGMAVTLDILAGGPLTGASMNPARSFGPTLIANSTKLWGQHWVYWAGPLLGGILAATVYHLWLWPRDERTGIEPGAADVPETQR